MPDALKPTDVAKRYRLDLSAMALDVAKTVSYRPGRQLQQGEDADYNPEIKKTGTPDMHNNFAVGDLLTPGARGKQPVSKLGTPVFADVILFRDGEDETTGVQLVWVLCTVDQPKNIAKTQILGKDGSDKEYMSEGDYNVTLRGAISRTFESNYPREEMERLIQLLKEKKSLNVTSKYLMQFGIYMLAVEGYTFSQEAGKQNLQRFEIRCSSDRPLILKEA